MCTLLQLKLHSQEGSKHRGRLENKLKNESIYVGNLSADDDEIENQEARATRELGKCMRLQVANNEELMQAWVKACRSQKSKRNIKIEGKSREKINLSAAHIEDGESIW